MEIGTDRFGLDAAIALHDDGISGLRDGHVGRRNGHHASTDKDTAEDQTGNSQSPNHPHTKYHALRALLSLRPSSPHAPHRIPEAISLALYSVSVALQTKLPRQLSLSPQKVARWQRLCCLLYTSDAAD